MTTFSVNFFSISLAFFLFPFLNSLLRIIITKAKSKVKRVFHLHAHSGMAPNIKTVVLSLLESCGGFLSRALAPASEVVVKKNHHKNCELSSGSFRPCNGFSYKNGNFLFFYTSRALLHFLLGLALCVLDLSSKRFFYYFGIK
jgi:hypothetical protein